MVKVIFLERVFKFVFIFFNIILRLCLFIIIFFIIVNKWIVGNCDWYKIGRFVRL